MEARVIDTGTNECRRYSTSKSRVPRAKWTASDGFDISSLKGTVADIKREQQMSAMLYSEHWQRRAVPQSCPQGAAQGAWRSLAAD